MARRQRPSGSQALGELLRLARGRREWTQYEAATHFGVTQPSYNIWENGQRRPADDRFDEVAAFLGCSIGEVWQLAYKQPSRRRAVDKAEIDQVLHDLRVFFARFDGPNPPSLVEIDQVRLDFAALLQRLDGR